MSIILRLSAHLIHWSRAAFAAAALALLAGICLPTVVLSAQPQAAFLPLSDLLLVPFHAAVLLFDLLLVFSLHRLRRNRSEDMLRMIPGVPRAYPAAIACTAALGLLLLSAAAVLGTLLCGLLHRLTAPMAVQALETQAARYVQQLPANLPATPLAHEVFYAFARHPMLRTLLPMTVLDGLMAISGLLFHTAGITCAACAPRSASTGGWLAGVWLWLALLQAAYARGQGLLFPLLLLIPALLLAHRLRQDDRLPRPHKQKEE